MAYPDVQFTCTALVGTQKKGVVPKDEHGYRRVVLGALGVMNSAGERYLIEGSRRHFEDNNSLLIKRMKLGALRSELGHPKRLPGMSDKDYVFRCSHIWENNVCAHIRGISLDFNSLKDSSGKPICSIVGEVGPSGPHGAVYDKAMDNPSENVSFSIRCFTDVFFNGQCHEKLITEVITFDMVNEPGIAQATKWNSPALESLAQESISADMVVAMLAGRDRSVTLESDPLGVLASLVSKKGWMNTQPVAAPVYRRPHFLNW